MMDIDPMPWDEVPPKPEILKPIVPPFTRIFLPKCKSAFQFYLVSEKVGMGETYTLPIKSPVPHHLDGLLAVVEEYVSSSILLRACRFLSGWDKTGKY